MAKRKLYKQKIIDHYKDPRNFGELEDHDYKIHLANSVCGDEITVFLKVEEGEITEVGFEGSGCAISIAGMSILSDKLVGMSLKEIMDLDEKYMLKLLGMGEKSPRVKCANLGLEAVQKAINLEEDEPCDFC